MSATRGTNKVMTVLAIIVACGVAITFASAAPPADGRSLTHRASEEVLLTGPSSGAPIRIWSQSDGLQQKLVWSRLEKGAWTEPRSLTFGPGDDMAPVVGTSSLGSMLYWIDERGRVLYAPFDPESGRLFAVPRPIPVSPLHRREPAGEGGTDAPVILGNCMNASHVPCAGPGPGNPLPSTPPRTDPGLEGGTDIPIVLTTGSTGLTTVTATSSFACTTQVLSMASDGMVTVVSVDGTGRVTLLGRLVLAPDVDPSEATAAAGTYYHLRTCK